MHLAPFNCLTKLSAKRVELVQKFVPRGRIRIFCNEYTWLILWDLNSCFGVFRTIWVHLVLFGCLTKLGATNAPDPSHWTLNSWFRTFHTILVHLGPFHCHTKLGANRAELVQKIVPRSRDGIFRNKRTRLNPFEPKLMFWCVSYYLGAFGTVWLRYKTRCKTGRSAAKVRATKSCRNCSLLTHPIHPIGP